MVLGNLDVYFSKAVFTALNQLARLGNDAFPGRGEVRSRLDVVYSTEHRRVRLLDVHVPKAKVGAGGQGANLGRRAARKRKERVAAAAQRSLLPLVIHVHGGGWVAGSKAAERGFCRALAARGFAVVSIDYGLAPAHRHPSQLLDLDAALQWASDHAPALGADPGRIFLMGESAGAHLAALFAMSYRDPAHAHLFGYRATVPAEAIAGMVLFCGVFDLERGLESGFPGVRSFTKGYLGGRLRPGLPSNLPHSPLALVGPSCPPTLIVAGAADPLFGQSIALADAMIGAGLPHSAFFAEGREAFHCFHFLPFLTCAQEAFEATVDFLRAGPRAASE